MSSDIERLIHQLLICNHSGPAKPLVDELVNRLCDITGLDLHPAVFLDEDATITAQGKAVSPTTAAQCGEDVARTRVFLQGVHQAIVDKLMQKSSESVNILYAGTGPFGLLLLPLLHRFDSALLRITLLDIHRDSLNKLQQVIDYLRVGKFIDAIHCTDACSWQTPQRFDVIVSETMRQGLLQEPQVSIFAHLQQFLAEDGWLIPEKIRLDLWLSAGASQQPPPVFLGQVFQLDKINATHIGNGNLACLRSSVLVSDYSPRLSDIKLTTNIQVYGEHELTENQSQLTLPLFEKAARPLPASEVHFRYLMGSYPTYVLDFARTPSVWDIPVPDSRQRSLGGIFHLPRLWHKTQLQKQTRSRRQCAAMAADEWLLDRQVLDELGVGLEPAMQQLYQTHSCDEFEAWVREVNGGDIPASTIAKANQVVMDFFRGRGVPAISLTTSNSLTAEQWAHWHEQGYLVIPGVLTGEEAQAARRAVWDFLQMREDDPATWYHSPIQMQKIMVQFFRHPTLDVARHKPIIRQIFTELWQRQDLVVTTDRVSFNPPETPHWRFPGPGLHWDVELKAPVPFGTQGLIYLTDTAENQGAFSCVPGFHQRIHQWLEQVPQDPDPAQQDWSLWPVKPIAANAGDLIIWHHALPHGSSPNRAQLPRIVQYINMYA